MTDLKTKGLLVLGINRKIRPVELSCERLYMKYCDSQLDNSTQELFERIEVELRGVDNLRLVDTAWLSCQDFRQRIEQLSVSVRARGGRVTNSSESIKNSKYA